MFTIQHTGSGLVTLHIQGVKNPVRCATEDVEKVQAAWVSHLLHNYLHHRFCVYAKVNKPAKAADIQSCMQWVATHRHNLPALRRMLLNNQAFFKSIEPKKENQWNTTIQQIMSI